MSRLFMLDTNIVSDIMKNPRGPAALRARAQQQQICTSIIVASELRYGCIKKRSATLFQRVEDILKEIEILPFDAPADTYYGRIRSEFETAGEIIGGNDLLIAAHASALNMILVTANTREFSRVSGLRLENWLGY